MSLGEEGCGYEGRITAKIIKIEETVHRKSQGLGQMRGRVLTARGIFLENDFWIPPTPCGIGRKIPTIFASVCYH